MSRRDSRFLRAPPYAFELGAVAAAAAIWRLLTKGARDEREAGREGQPPGSVTMPVSRRQS
ncbi:MAG TPA: hypothetical protein VFB42_05865 [Gaiellaceae bacterium]|nr:hypothetical protein [Gaiellaceae bacterium]